MTFISHHLLNISWWAPPKNVHILTLYPISAQIWHCSKGVSSSIEVFSSWVSLGLCTLSFILSISSMHSLLHTELSPSYWTLSFILNSLLHTALSPSYWTLSFILHSLLHTELSPSYWTLSFILNSNIQLDDYTTANYTFRSYRQRNTGYFLCILCGLCQRLAKIHPASHAVTDACLSVASAYIFSNLVCLSYPYSSKSYISENYHAVLSSIFYNWTYSIVCFRCLYLEANKKCGKNKNVSL